MKKMYLCVVLVLVLGLVFTGCATVPSADWEVTIPTEESLSNPSTLRVEQDTVGAADEVTIVTEESLNNTSVYNNN